MEKALYSGYSDYKSVSTAAFRSSCVPRLPSMRAYRRKSTKRETRFPTVQASSPQHVLSCTTLHSSPRSNAHYWKLVERDRAARGLCPAARSIDVKKAWDWGLSDADWFPMACHFSISHGHVDISHTQRLLLLSPPIPEPREAFLFRYRTHNTLLLILHPKVIDRLG